jgi:hypothetical protein
MSPVRFLTRRWRVLCSISTACCSGVFTATNRIVGRVTASQIGSASDASVFPRFTYGFTYAGGISRSSWPRPMSSRAQYWADAHASMPTRQGDSPEKNFTTSARRSRRRTSTLPAASIAWTWNTFFARSYPTVTAHCCMDGSL